ncbi:DNA invertase Pin-like site-specific DNA recombinase [Nonomuraea muscovyensis]|uniref:DNA invertase Pin-like site-specific DNA recombinase n=1 Tax=Nonomuraea muscovyensis TaxID=1124761 RepID=A0A7X0F3C2_9ACTN|nr:recombinase family protein [Nonomuraea muscovyensis]MBB6351876.1 DNA invertase Pin-like site-specific DNA recombinase [Nonomuraea muscovyensis]
MQRDAIIYVRISRDRIGAGLGVERQRIDCENLAARLGWNVVAVYDDNDMSAYSGKPRPGYKRMLEDLRAGSATGVLAWHTDRLHRSPTELEEYIQIVERHGVDTQTVRTGQLDLSTPAGRMNARNLGNFARYEVEHMSERQQAKKLQKAAAGEWFGGRRPFGFEPDGVTVRTTEAAELDARGDDLLSGLSVHAVVRDWNARGVTTATGGKWTPNSVRRVFLRPRNAGLMEHRGEIVGPAKWPAIIEETKWRAIVALLNDPSRRTTPGPQRRWMGSGLYECGICVEAEEEKTTVVVATAGLSKGGQRKTVPSYRCAAGRNHVARSPIHLDRYVSMLAVEWLSRPGAVEAFERKGDDSAARARVLEREALRIRDEEAAEMFAAGQMTKAQLIAANEKTAQRRSELDQADAAAARVTALAPFRKGDPQAVWDGLDLDRRRAVISQIMRVIILPGKLGRPEGWTPEYGKEWGYFDPKYIRVEWRVRA